MSNNIIACVVVVVEPIALNLMRSYVEKMLFLVLKKNCSSAIEFIKTETVNLLLLDIQMPEFVEYINNTSLNFN